MSKEFKDYDKLYSDLKHKAYYPYERVHIIQAEGAKVKSWVEKVYSWSQEDVQFAVYKAGDHEDWQKFRVSLKGFTTGEKLYRLQGYLYSRGSQHCSSNMQMRVDNYIGCLVRGGFLSSDGKYTVLK